MKNPEQQFEAVMSPIVIGENSVSYLGVEVPKGQGGRLVPKAEEFKEEYFYLEGHHKTMREVATALLLNKPILLEGGTGVYNKTTTIAKMCHDLNMNYCKVNFDRETVREDVIGGHTLKIDENGKEKLEWYDGDLMYAIRNGGVAFLDEYNRQSKLAGIINPIMDAILNGRKEIANPYNENERVRVHQDFRLVGAQNPPGFEEGHEYTDRSQLPAETFGRWLYRKLPIEYSEEEQNKLLAGVIGEKVDINLPESEFRHSGEGLPVGELAEIPGMSHWRKEIVTIARVLEAKSSGARREMATGQRQNLYFNPRLIMSTIPQYIARFYRGDINETIKNAFETCVIGMYSSEADKQKIRLMLDQASWKPPVAESKRKGLEREKEVVGDIEYLSKPLSEGENIYKPGQLVKGDDGKISVFIGVSKIDGSGVFRPYEEEFSTVKYDTFLKDTFGTKGIEIPFISRDPKKLKSEDWEKLSKDIDSDKSGEYTLNLEMAVFGDADFERMAKLGKIKIEKLPDDKNGQPLTKVIPDIVKAYGDNYYIPGLEFYQWALANPDKLPEDFKDGNLHFFFGSTFRDSTGPWSVPALVWNGGSWDRLADWLGGGWDSDYRVVLLAK